MKQVKDHIFSNVDFPTQTIEGVFFQKTKIRGLIMGPTGNGKTNLVNNICNQRFESGVSEGSKTRDIVYSDVSQFQQGIFRIYDTPGTDSKRDALQHALVLKASLTLLPINIVIFVVKYDCRFQKCQQAFKQMRLIFKKSKAKVVLMISHFDMFDKKENSLKQYLRYIDKGGLNVPIILFSNKKSNPAVLSRMLYYIGAQSQAVMIEIEEKTFNKCFKLGNHVIRPDHIFQQYQGYIQQIEVKLGMFADFFKANSSLKNVDSELLTEAKIYAKYYLKQLQNQQYTEYYVKFDDDYLSTNLFLLISQIIQKKLEEFDTLTFQKLEKKFYEDHFKKSEDITDSLKACPKCGLIWMKVKDCNKVSCGNKPGFFDFFRNKDNFKFQWKQVNGKLSFDKKELPKVDQKKIEKSQETRKDKGKDLGCGYQFDWGMQPRIPNIEQILKNLYGVNNYQQITLNTQFLLKNSQNYKNSLEDKLKKTYETLNRDRKVSPVQSRGESLLEAHRNPEEKLRQGLKVDQETLKKINSTKNNTRTDIKLLQLQQRPTVQTKPNRHREQEQNEQNLKTKPNRHREQEQNEQNLKTKSYCQVM